MNDTLRRQKAMQATEARWRWQVADWKARCTCLHMLHFHLKAMGHKVPRLPAVRGPLAARKALAERGWANMAELMDAQGFERVAPAAMRVGDVAYRSSADGLGSVMLCVSAHKLLGWFENDPRMVVMDMSFDQVEAAWKV